MTERSGLQYGLIIDLWVDVKLLITEVMFGSLNCGRYRGKPSIYNTRKVRNSMRTARYLTMANVKSRNVLGTDNGTALSVIAYIGLAD